MTDREAMQQALKALTLLKASPNIGIWCGSADDSITALSERLAQPEPDGRKLQRMRQEAWRITDAQWKDDPSLCFALGYEAGYNDAVAPRVEPRASESGAGFESLPASPPTTQPELEKNA